MFHVWYYQLEKFDYEKLETYWLNFQRLANTKETDPLKSKNIKRITTAIETLYNASSGLARGVIELGYFDNVTTAIDSKHVAAELNTTMRKVTNIRQALMKDTAELISWV